MDVKTPTHDMLDPGPLHWRDRLINAGARYLVRPSLGLPIPWSVHRAMFALGGALRRRAKGVRVEKTTLGGRPALICTPPTPQRRLVWVHGGGFTVGSPRTHLAMATHIARAADAVVILPSYRRAPEHPYPTASGDTYVAIGEAQSIREDLGALCLGGDSAGGNLVLGALSRHLAMGRRFGALVLSSPATILDPDRPVPQQANDILFPLSILRRIGRDYGNGADPKLPTFSPVYADFSGAPPTLVHCARGEWLEEDTDTIAERLASAGAPVHVEKAARAPHAFHFMAGASPQADHAVARMVAFLQQHTP
ncbi:MAG: alpha/beta hydrolase fold domain-containing protein [Pseudomonadota bacterium]